MSTSDGGGDRARRRLDARGEPDVRVFEDADGASWAAAETIAVALRSAVEARGRADWATTGGSTPTGVYRHLAEAPLRDEVPWAGVHVWWGDDRFVPRDHPQSNVLPLDAVLLSVSGRAGMSGTGGDAAMVDTGQLPGVPLLPEQLHAPRMSQAIAAGEGPEWVAQDYERQLRAAGLPTAEDGLPILDIVFLGIGPDGHILSVFPGSPLLESDAWVSAVPAPTHVEPHVARISMNPGVVGAAQLPIVVAHGSGKAAIIAEVLRSERDVARLPAQLARREGAIWFLDQAAAAELRR